MGGALDELVQEVTVTGTTVAMVRTATTMAPVWHEATIVAAIIRKVVGGEEIAVTEGLDEGVEADGRVVEKVEASKGGTVFQAATTAARPSARTAVDR